MTTSSYHTESKSFLFYPWMELLWKSNSLDSRTPVIILIAAEEMASARLKAKSWAVGMERKKREHFFYPSYRGRREENRDNRQTIEPHLKQRPSEEPEVEKPTNNRIPAKSFTSVNLWNTDCRAADNSQGSLKQGYSAKDYWVTCRADPTPSGPHLWGLNMKQKSVPLTPKTFACLEASGGSRSTTGEQSQPPNHYSHERRGRDVLEANV